MLDYFLLGENVSWSILVGGVFILVGLVMVAMAQYREQKEEVLNQLHSRDPIPLEEFGSITHDHTKEGEKEQEEEQEVEQQKTESL